MSRIAFAALALLFAGPVGCSFVAGGALAGAGAGAMAAREIGVKPGGAVRVRFHKPHDVALIGSDSLHPAPLADVSYLIGRVRVVRGDTLWMTLSEAESLRTVVRYPQTPAPMTRIVRDAHTRIEPLGNTVGYVLTGAAIGLVAGVGAFFWTCTLNPCFN